ncbi:hypothetical protein DFH06DRAFT_1336612 [Mycena polygramma]|nr:hypothetical protein DFH06DRAFT_1336612 [Mycena polygramma]
MDDPPNASEEPSAPKPPVQQVRKYRKIPPPLTIPSIPAPPDASSYRAPGDFISSIPPLPLPVPFPHTQAPLRHADADESAAARAKEKFLAMDEFLKDLAPFESLGDFLAILFHNRVHGQPDPRGLTHSKAVARFLQGTGNVRMSDVFPLIYKHQNSFPSISSSRAHEKEAMFSTEGPLADIHTGGMTLRL